MNRIKLFTKFMMPCGLCVSIPAVKAANPIPENVPHDESTEKKTVRPSDLPIYVPDNTQQKAIPCSQDKPDALEESIGTVRKSVTGFVGQFTSYKNSVTDKFNTGVEHSKMTLEFLRDEDNILPRIGAVGIGGLSGLILSLRRGKFKKVLYTGTGALFVASVCYPQQAKESVTAAKYYANVTYNFLYGVKPEDGKQLEISWPELPKVPTNFTEFSDLASSSFNWAVAGITSLVSKATEAASGSKEDSKKAEDPKKN